MNKKLFKKKGVGKVIKSGINTIKLWPNQKANPNGTPATLTEFSEKTRIELTAQEFEDDGKSNWLRDKTLNVVNKKMRNDEFKNSENELLLNIELISLKYPIYIFNFENENENENKLKSFDNHKKLVQTDIKNTFFEISKKPNWILDEELKQQNLTEIKHHILSKSKIYFIHFSKKFE